MVQTPDGGEPASWVLVVDDDLDFRVSVAAVIAMRLPGVRVATVDGIKDAKHFLERHAVDLVVTDYRMHGGNGITLRMDLKRTHPGVPCLLVTAQADLGVITQALDTARFDGVLCKPAKASRIVELVRDLLAHHTGRPVPTYE